jgi:mono/diheme cytochrome c family protein
MLSVAIKTTTKLVLGMGLLGFGATAFADGWDPTSQASAIGSIANTRHNLTVSYNSLGQVMDLARNNYGAICVYCHTPHGANGQIQAPLWNRTINPGNYTIYDKPTTLMRPIGLPGPNSLTCLSCHDGTIAIDSVLNMPGSGGYGNNEVGTSNMAFLDNWSAAGNPGPSGDHFVLGPELGTSNTGCAFCHTPGNPFGAPDYSVFMLGTDLRNDHPVGVQFPTSFGPEIDFNEPNVKVPGKWAFFDVNGNNHADKNEVRLYDTGDGPEVECASCHDPHGIPSNGAGTRFNPSFLRVNNGIAGTHNGTTGIVSDGPSALCLTCHSK